MLDPTASRFGQAVLLSGLMDAEALRACWEAIPPDKREAPEHIDRRLARQAVQSSALTLWQAQQLLAGRTQGFKVDRYILLELIGQGGMGRVYLARDTRLNRRVALKILAPERLSNPRAVARFQREARVGAQLQHENLVRVYDFGESNGRYFLVMEFIEGKTIGSLISAQGRLSPWTAARLTRQVALGLAHAHAKGMIHRDVNPFNVMVTNEGVAKLADLGLAIDLTEEQQRVTRDGATVGTFDYVAPEQARHSHAADIRSDIYSLGCSLYHMLTGHVPFPSPSLPEKLFAHQAMEPAPLEPAVPGLPPGLSDIVRTMMRKHPEERYATPMQLVQALEPFAVEPAAGGADRAAGPGPGPVEVPSRRASTSDPSPTVPIAAGAAAPAPDRERRAAAVATGGRPTPSTDLDDPAVPLLTPTEEGVDEFSIVVDLGPEPPLREVAARSRSGPGPKLSTLFQAATSAISGEFPAGGKPAAAGRPGGKGLPRWGRLAIPAAVAAAAMVVALGMSGRLTPIWGGAGAPSTRPMKETPNHDRSRQPTRAEGPMIVVRRHGGVDGADDVPAPSLAEAIQAAIGPMGRAGYVELRNREPIRLGPRDLPDLHSGSGTLDIRAAAGHRPVIEVRMEPGKPWIATGSAVSLVLSGLTIRVLPADEKAAGDAPAVIESAGRVRLDRCAFEVAGHQAIGCALSTDGGSMSVERCWFRGFGEAIRIKAFDETVASIHQTMIVPMTGAQSPPPGSEERRGWAIGLQLLPGKPAKESKRRLTLDHCTVEEDGLLAVEGNAGPSPMPVEVAHCAVRAGAILSWKPRNPGARFGADVAWKGTGNQLHVLGPSWVVMSASSMTPELSLGATDLASWTKFVPREVDPIRTRVQYQAVPHARGEPPRPADFEIESTRALDDRAGADPERVGPWGK